MIRLVPSTCSLYRHVYAYTYGFRSCKDAPYALCQNSQSTRRTSAMVYRSMRSKTKCPSSSPATNAPPPPLCKVQYSANGGGGGRNGTAARCVQLSSIRLLYTFRVQWRTKQPRESHRTACRGEPRGYQGEGCRVFPPKYRSSQVVVSSGKKLTKTRAGGPISSCCFGRSSVYLIIQLAPVKGGRR